VKTHSLAKSFPAMLMDEAAALERDIQANKQRQPIVLFEGKILDGRHRYAVCTKLGIEPTFTTFEGTEVEAKALVLSLNVHRRHLTFAQKEAIVAAELQRDPAQSDRAIADVAKVSPTTVGKVRAKAEATGDVSTVDTSTDTLGRKQPRKRKPKAATGEPPTKVAIAHTSKPQDLEAKRILRGLSAIEPQNISDPASFGGDLFAHARRFGIQMNLAHKKATR